MAGRGWPSQLPAEKQAEVQQLLLEAQQEVRALRSEVEAARAAASTAEESRQQSR